MRSFTSEGRQSAYNQWIYKRRRYDAVNDFAPVALFSKQPLVLQARKDLPANDLREFMALLKSNGSEMQYGSAGAGTTMHLASALLNSRIGVDVTHVPYRGSAPAANDLIGGQFLWRLDGVAAGGCESGD